MKEEYPKVYLYRRLVQAKLFIDEHFAEPIDLDDICNTAFFSKFHFIRLFRKSYDETPHQYLSSVRIENAKELLQKENSVTDTCFTVGFNSVSSFSGLFRHYTKFSPSAYQQEYKKRRELIKKDPLQFIPHCFAEQKGWIKNSNFQEIV